MRALSTFATWLSALRRAARPGGCCWRLACGGALAAAPPPVALARADAGLHGARVPPNLLLNLSLTHAAAAAAHGGDYAPQREYAGYFHARMCYSYPYRSKDGVMLPDLRVATAYFSVLKPADALHGCGGDSFSGNFLNWASASMLDIVRYALTGGDRVIDEVRKTVLQRAYLPDADSPIDFFAHPVFFPRKVLQTGVAAATPFALAQLAIVSCRNRLLFGDASLAAFGRQLATRLALLPRTACSSRACAFATRKKGRCATTCASRMARTTSQWAPCSAMAAGCAWACLAT